MEVVFYPHGASQAQLATLQLLNICTAVATVLNNQGLILI
jgi:hypothetical protein